MKRSLAVLLLLAVPAFGAAEFDGSTQYLELSSALFSAYPWSASALFNADAASATQQVFFLGLDNSTITYIGMVLLSTSAVRSNCRDGGAFQGGATSTTFSLDTWSVAGTSNTNSTSRDVYLDGGGKGSSTGTCDPHSGVNNTTLGVWHDPTIRNHLDGSLALVGAWDVALTDAEQAILGLGVDPRLVRPASIVSFWPLLASGDYNDYVSGNTMTATGSPTTDTNPPVFLWY